MRDRISIKCWMAMLVGDCFLWASIVLNKIGYRMGRVVVREIEGGR